jgi:hypothetical protein
MIAQRFRALGWVAGIASAATGLYLISLQVAAERAKLEEVDRRIVSAQRDMRQLQTELGTRASMRQLERWNDDVLALAAPHAEQYLRGEYQLASLSSDVPVERAGMTAPHAVLTAAAPAEATEKPSPRVIQAVVPPRRTPPAAAPEVPGLERVAFEARGPGRPQRVAMVERTVIDRATLGDIVQKAAVERRKRP